MIFSTLSGAVAQSQEQASIVSFLYPELVRICSRPTLISQFERFLYVTSLHRPDETYVVIKVLDTYFDSKYDVLFDRECSSTPCMDSVDHAKSLEANRKSRSNHIAS